MTKYIQRLISLYCILMLAVMPLYFHDGYNDILDAKAFIVWAISLVMLLLILPALIKRSAEYTRKKTKKGGTVLSLLDISVLVFGGWALISSIASEWRLESFTGEEAWYVGSLLIAMLVVWYFIISRYASAGRFYLVMFFASIAVIMILALLNDMNRDPAELLRSDLAVYWRDSFSSTIGNVDVFAGYLSIVIPFLTMLFINIKQPFLKVFSAVVLFLCFMAMYMTHADGVYLGVAAGMAFVVWYAMRDSGRFLMLLVSGVIFGLAGYGTMLLSRLFPEVSFELISPVLLGHRVYFYAGIASFVMILIHMALEQKVKKEKIDRALQKLSLVYLIGLIVAVACAAIYLAGVFEPGIFNRRGVIWDICIKVFRRGDIKEYLLGLGTACIDLDARSFSSVILEYYGAIYDIDTAHNEILEYLVCTGIPGCAAYLMIFAVPLVSVIRGAYEKKSISKIDEQAYFMAGIAGYFGQGLMYGPHPLNFAILMVLLGLFRSVELRDRVGKKPVAS